jgi:hypothetical protein
MSDVMIKVKTLILLYYVWVYDNFIISYMYQKNLSKYYHLKNSIQLMFYKIILHTFYSRHNGYISLSPDMSLVLMGANPSC